MKNKTANTATIATSLKVALFAMLLFFASATTVSAQTVVTAAVQTGTQNVSVANNDTTVAGTHEAAASSLNMMSWFAGTKQTPKATISSDAATSSKKQMINAGVAPNRLLIKVFAKKASSFQMAVA